MNSTDPGIENMFDERPEKIQNILSYITEYITECITEYITCNTSAREYLRKSVIHYVLLIINTKYTTPLSYILFQICINCNTVCNTIKRLIF